MCLAYFPRYHLCKVFHIADSSSSLIFIAVQQFIVWVRYMLIRSIFDGLSGALNLNPVIQCVSHQYSQLFFFSSKSKALLGPSKTIGGRTNNRFPCLLASLKGRERACSLYVVRVGVCLGGWKDSLKMLVAQSCPALYNPMNCSLEGVA